MLFSKRFLPLLGVAFCSAFIDNAVRLIAIAQVIGSESLYDKFVRADISDWAISPNFEASTLVAVLGVFSLPFIFLAMPAGLFSIVGNRKRIVIYSMASSFFLAGVFVFSLLYNIVFLSLVIVCLLGLKSTLLSPAKYTLIRTIVGVNRTGEGVAWLVFSTTIGVLFGTFFSVLWLLSQSTPGGAFWEQGLLWTFIFLGLLGLLFGSSLPDTDSASESGVDTTKTFSWFDGFWRSYAVLRKQDRESAKYLLLAVLGLAIFWSLASVQQLSISYTSSDNTWNPMVTAVLLTALALGVCYGAIVAAKASSSRVELGLLPLAMIILAVAHSMIAMSSMKYTIYFPLLFLMGFGGSFLAIPCYMYLLNKTPDGREPIAIAVSNAVIHICVLLSLALLSLSLSGSAISPSKLYLYCGLVCVIAMLYLFTLIPGVFLRFVNWLLVHTLYSLKVYDSERIPQNGGALLVCNHLSFVDAMLVLAAIDRPVRFLIFRPIYENPWIKPFARAMGAIPVEAGRSREEIDRALAAASEGIRKGELVCIFAEGGISRVGRLLPFKRGLERIMVDVDAPIIPVYLDQIWTSVFSYRGGKFFWKRPKAVPLPVTVNFGEPIPANTKAVDVRRAVQGVAVEAFKRRPLLARDMRLALLESLTRQRFSRRVSDSSGVSLRAFELLAGISLFKRIFTGKKGERIGVCLPPTVVGVVANLSTVVSGRVPVNLNYTTSSEALHSALEQAEIKTVISSRAFCEKLSLSFADMNVNVVWVEDLTAQTSSFTKAIYAAACCLLPRAIIGRLFFGLRSSVLDEQSSAHSAANSDPSDEVLSILFSSGSTGEPKGVMLSHRNVSSNVVSLLDLLDLDNKDALVGILPFFHSFGHTATLWYPLIAGIPVVYHSNPLDGRTIGKLIDKHSAKVLFATPTFLKMYLRKGKAEQFSQLRYLVVGAERLSESVRESCIEKFKVAPLEGYGCTELSPLAIVNVPDIQHGKIKQVGSKAGSVGTPIPGVIAKVVDPETFVEKDEEEEGLLLIKGPNVMLGYLNKETLTSEVIKDDWYVTGDIARIDGEGFVEISGRLSRFAKIAGEMIPLTRLEECIIDFCCTSDEEASDMEHGDIVAVASVPDEKKGEKLVVLSVVELDASAVAAHLKEIGLPNLWIPSEENYRRVDDIPLLGSGKRDLRAINELALKV
jgi:acyl-[acyl-carrier-protein]-phospholipid O-acyltransferase/long-chain-fatty-acid--[acyl-carrier-protein] ligase